MKNKYLSLLLVITLVFSILYLGIGCQKEIPPASEEETATEPPAAPTPPAYIPAEEAEEVVTEDETVEKLPRTERPCHVLMEDSGQVATYLYREFIQLPMDVEYGPDGYLYVADWTGRHIVKISPDGEMSDLGIWKDPDMFTEDGPTQIAFDSSGKLYFCTHNQIYSVSDDNSVEIVPPNTTLLYPFGGITFSPSDELYYTDRGSGRVLKISQDGSSQVVAEGIENAACLAFGLDGTLYVSQMFTCKIFKVNVLTGEVTEFCSIDMEPEGGFSLAVDSDGDIWARGFLLHQISPNGDEKPFWVDGTPGLEKSFHTGSQITFDEEGNLYVLSYSSRIWKLTPTSSNRDDYTSSKIVPGFEAYDLDVGPNGEVYAYVWSTEELIRFDPDGSSEVIFNYEGADYFPYGIAVDSSGTLFIASETGEIEAVNADGSLSHYFSEHVYQLVGGYDGYLYAITIADYP